MHLQRTIRRGLRLLAQLYADAARAHTAHSHISVTTGPSAPVEAARRAENHHPAEHEDCATRHG
ncbi:hypothetical protein ACFUJR_36520 [Streptomyces sp. NPDC057271]|uniref:hypothetical protein n=1 Tax=unclassified Streptomyces TaxID=2593676 RepID=UPI00363D34D3